MTDKEFVLSIYPNAAVCIEYFNSKQKDDFGFRKCFIVVYNDVTRLSGWCASERDAWQAAKIVTTARILQKLEI